MIEIEIPVFVETLDDGTHEAWIYANRGRYVQAGYSEEYKAGLVSAGWEQSAGHSVIRRHVVWLKAKVPVPPESPVVEV